MSGIDDSLIAAILYATGKNIWTKLNEPLANSIDRTITYFSKEKGIEISRDKFAALLGGRIGQEEVNSFREGEKFIDGDKLALQFAIFGDLYFEDESKTLENANAILSYFKSVLTDELLRDPRSSMQTLSSIQSIFGKISQEEHKRIMKAIEGIREILCAMKQPEVPVNAEGEHRAVLKEELGTIKMLGSPDVPNVPVDLLDTFVSLNITAMSAGKYREDLEPNEMHDEADRKLTPESALKRAFKKYRMLLILGDPGCGKTTLIKYYAMLCLKGERHKELGFHKAPLPIYLPLREIVSKDGNLCPLHECLAKWASRHYLSIPAETFLDWLKNRQTLVLLDGLDEISDLDRRERICQWIDNAAVGLTNAYFVVTSRWTGYRKVDGIELSFDHLNADIRDFSPEQQKEFLEKWFVAAYLREPRDEKMLETQWRQRQRQQGLGRAKAIVDFLAEDENKSVRELAGVPMLLQIIAILWRERENLPEGRAELYQAAVNYLLVHRDRPKKMKAPLPAAKALCVLRPVSFWMQNQMHSDQVMKEQMHGSMQPILDTMREKVGPEAFCEYLRDRAGLIADYGKDSYIFRHKSFREYLVGRELVTKAERDTECFERIVGQFGEDWWNEPLRFFMGEVDDILFDQFMDALFKSDTSKELDQKSYNLLLRMVNEAPQRRIDSLVRRLNDDNSTKNQRRYMLDCLKTIGSEEAFEAIKEFGEKHADTETGSFAQDITFEAVSDVLSVQDAVKVKITDKSFRNRFELNAEYILIPGGKFTYQGKIEEEVPDIYFAKYPVTNKRYSRFIRYLEEKEQELLKILPKGEFNRRLIEFTSMTKGFSENLGVSPDALSKRLDFRHQPKKRFDDEEQPVVGITWFAACTYCFWLSALETANQDVSILKIKNIYRLPTEIEWEWAAGGGKRKYPWLPEKGSPSDKLANYDNNVGITTPVGRYPEGATPEGLMDMAGNAWEWMKNKYSYEIESRSLRGGSWNTYSYYLRCVARNRNLPNSLFELFGFRVVRSQL